MCFFNVVHDVKFTYILKVLVHRFDQVMDELQVGHFILNKYKRTSSSKSSPKMKYKDAYLL